MTRFKPTRAGIIGVWDYTIQEFRFADGRLVLRGPNGSGKTKALEVLVPFVLDGSTDPRRLDPFSGKDRTMQSNLLYGGDTSRRGYCWLEFRRGDEVVTVGVGMRAQEHARLTTWFFVTDRVVGESLSLVGEDRVPMTRKAMRALLGDEQCFDTRDAHRQAVNRRLFGFEGERYASMIELVLTLRRPQLAKELDPDSLSDVLSAGLRTVDPELLRDSAQAFDDLESTQRDLSALERADQAVADLATTWRTYLRTRARLRLNDVEDRGARVLRAEGEVQALSEQVARLEAQVREHRARGAQAQARQEAAASAIDALKQHEAYRNQGALDDMRRLVEGKREERDAAQRRADKRKKVAEEATRALAQARRRHDEASDKRRDAQRLLTTRADLAQVPLREPIDAEALRIDLVRQQTSVGEALRELATLDAATRERATAEKALQARIAELEEALQARTRAQEALDRAIAERVEAIGAWHDALPDALREPLDLTALQEAAPAAPNAPELPALVSDAWRPLNSHLLAERARQEDQAKAHDSRIKEIDAFIHEIRAERDDAPPRPPTRSTSRSDRPGAPLWRLVRFADGVAPADRAALEGALLASGLLDAWVDPQPVDPSSRDDTHLRVGPAATSPTLWDVLVPEVQDVVPHDRVEALLRSVPLEDAGVFIGRDGAFALGPLAGAHRPDRARYIGATARQQHREERIAGLTQERAQEERLQLAAMGEVARINELIDALEAASSALPPNTAVRAARTRADEASAVARTAQEAQARAQREADTAERLRAEAERSFRRAALDRGLPTDGAVLRALGAHVAEAAQALKDYNAAASIQEECAASLRGAQARHDEAEREQLEAAEDASTATSAHETEQRRYDTLQSTLGAAVLEVQRKIEAASAERQAARAEAEAATREEHRVSNEAAGLRGRMSTIEEKLPQDRSDLASALAALDPFREAAVASALDVAPGESPFEDRLAERVDGAATTPERLKATETQLNNRLADLDDALGSRFHHVHRVHDGVVVVSIVDEEGEADVTAFQRRNAERLERIRDLLVEREQRVFEEHLLASLISRLRDRIAETRELTTAMDTAMRARRLASGKHVGVRWAALPGAEPARKELLDLLAFDPTFLSPDKLARMRALLSTEVQTERRDNPDRTYLEILMRALDYRAWHRFELFLYDAAGNKKRLSRAVHGLLSGGEKAATVHLPLFAAAHAHFGAATVDCPRLIALDEAFAGIDETGAPELLRLAAEFDLDWFLTGHNLWVTEPFLPAVMHYDLAHDETTRAVSAWPILWNGRETVEGVESVESVEA